MCKIINFQSLIYPFTFAIQKYQISSLRNQRYILYYPKIKKLSPKYKYVQITMIIISQNERFMLPYLNFPQFATNEQNKQKKMLSFNNI